MTPLPDDLDLTDWDTLWTYLEENDSYEVRFALFEALLPIPQLDNEIVFELLNEMFDEAIMRGERDQFDQLILALRKQQPAIFEQEAHFMFDWLITNALANGRYQDAHTYALELAQITHHHLDIVIMNINKLAYHNQLDTIHQMAQIGWPLLNNDEGKEYFDWAIQEFILRASNFTIFNYLENTLEPNFADPELLTAIAQYVMPKPAGVEYHLKQLTYQSNYDWQIDDFTFVPLKKQRRIERIPEEIRNNIGDLTAEFLGYLRHVEGVSFAKGSLVNTKYGEYILQQLEKRLTTSHIVKKKGDKNSGYKNISVPLIPDRASFEEELLKYLHFLNPNPHIAAAMFDLVPAWLRFLESRGLIDAAQRQSCLQQLASLADDFIKFWGEAPADPTLPTAATQWRENAGLDN